MNTELSGRRYFREDLFKETTHGTTLVGNKCTECGSTFFPKVDFCTHCLNKRMEEVELSKRGVLYSYTITHVPVGKYPLPHAVGMITLPEKVRLTAPLVISPGGFQIGSSMEMIIDTLWAEDNCEIIGYKFRSVSGIPKKEGEKC